MVVRRHEYDLRFRAGVGHRCRHFQARQAGHADIEESNVRLVLVDHFQRGPTVIDRSDNVKIRPLFTQQVDERIAEKLLVFSDHAGQALIHGWPPWGRWLAP